MMLVYKSLDSYTSKALNLKQSVGTFFYCILQYKYFYLALINQSLDSYTNMRIN